jgi:hypothetical protein
MPTTIRAVVPTVTAAPSEGLGLRTKFYALINDPDFFPIIIFCTLGLAAAIFLTAYFPLSSDVVDLLSSTT